MVFPIVQSYKFKSKSQLDVPVVQVGAGVSDSSKLQIQKQITTYHRCCGVVLGCFRQFKVTNSKANHNWKEGIKVNCKVFPIVQRYKFKSKSQLGYILPNALRRCFRQFNYTNSKANHNQKMFIYTHSLGVSDSSKLQIQKQITTRRVSTKEQGRCFRQFKVTNSKANHNRKSPCNLQQRGVSDSSKLQIQKQITTQYLQVVPSVWCFRQFKVTNSKANGAEITVQLKSLGGVSDGSEL